MFYEVEVLAENNPGTFGQAGAFAQAYSLFDAALGMAVFVGPAGGGLFLEQTTWQITAGVLAIFCAAGALPVYFYTGGFMKGKGKINGHDDEAWWSHPLIILRIPIHRTLLKCSYRNKRSYLLRNETFGSYCSSEEILNFPNTLPYPTTLRALGRVG